MISIDITLLFVHTLIKTNYKNILQDGYVRYVRYGYGHDEFI